VKDMQIPEMKKQVRKLIGFFSYFQDYIPDFAEIAQPLTDLAGKRVPNRVPWGEKENLAFEKLKEELCKATTQSMSITDFSKCPIRLRWIAVLTPSEQHCCSLWKAKATDQ